jgi:hypothetical protein
MRKIGKKGGRAKITQIAMKKATQNKRSRSNIGKVKMVETVWCGELEEEEEEDVKINPLPTPAFVHFDAGNTETPKFRFTPSLNPKLHKRFTSENH